MGTARSITSKHRKRIPCDASLKTIADEDWKSWDRAPRMMLDPINVETSVEVSPDAAFDMFVAWNVDSTVGAATQT
jgi:hypothetical protein